MSKHNLMHKYFIIITRALGNRLGLLSPLWPFLTFLGIGLAPYVFISLSPPPPSLPGVELGKIRNQQGSLSRRLRILLGQKECQARDLYNNRKRPLRRSRSTVNPNV